MTDELDKVFALWGGPPLVLRMDNGPEFISHVLQQFRRDRVGISYIPPGTPWNNGHIESFNNRLRKECLNRNYWTSLLEARVVIEDFKDDLGQSAPPLLARLPHTCVGVPPACEGVRCPMHPFPPTGGRLRDRLN
ncbi:integrase core domain-containing protein [Rhodococcoides fascians]|uniref:integrase core domain-containing protein n=1 Tax=Rhodococcoides fascians TaxID=1828 RepID=UPI0009B857D0|nr:integrase core domain-containing protein [Rhodococcus fascians]